MADRVMLDIIQKTYKDFLLYDLHEGLFYIVKSKDKPEGKRQIFPDEEGYLTFFRQGKKYKLKANKAAVEIGNNLEIQDDQVVLHKNLDYEDFSLKNLQLVSRDTLKQVKEAHRNLSGALLMKPHASNAFCYVLQWKEEGRVKTMLCEDVVVAKREYLKLKLKYAKLLSKYCVFD